MVKQLPNARMKSKTAQRDGIELTMELRLKENETGFVEKFLRDIAGGKYNTLIVPSFDQLPSLDEAKLPRFRVISLEEQVTREIGLLERPLIPSEDNAPNINNAAVYCRLAQQEQDEEGITALDTFSL